MSITITDPKLLEQLMQAGDTVDLVGPDGKRLGQFLIEYPGSPPPGFKIPFTEAELDELSKQRDGRPLADILRDLEARYGK